MTIPSYIYRELTLSERGRMLSAKRTLGLVAVILALVCSGCTTVVTPAGDKSTYLNSNWGIVNNTGYDLDVFQDGAKIASLTPGQVLTLPPATWREASLVSVSAYAFGQYVGANSYTFSRYTVYNWQIDHVHHPGGVLQ